MNFDIIRTRIIRIIETGATDDNFNNILLEYPEHYNYINTMIDIEKAKNSKKANRKVYKPRGKKNIK